MEKKQDTYLIILDKLDETLARLDRFQAKMEIMEKNFSVVEHQMDRYHSAVVYKFEEMQDRIHTLEAQIEYLLQMKKKQEHGMDLSLPLQ